MSHGDRAPAPAPAPPSPPRAAEPPPTTAHSQLAVGTAYACVRTTGDKLTCWGRTYPDLPTVVTGVEHVAGVATAQATTCAWTTAGEVYCIAGGPTTQIEGLSDAVEVATDPDAFVMCARRRSGHVACWSDFDKAAPVHDVGGITGALEIAVAGTTACIRDATGVGCWNTADPKDTLHRIAAAAGATRIVGGGFSFVALRGDRPPVGWNEAPYGPLALPSLPAGVVQIALGGKRGCALVDHAVQCWTLTELTSIHPIANVERAVEIAVGYSLGFARASIITWRAGGRSDRSATARRSPPTRRSRSRISTTLPSSTARTSAIGPACAERTVASYAGARGRATRTIRYPSMQRRRSSICSMEGRAHHASGRAARVECRGVARRPSTSPARRRSSITTARPRPDRTRASATSITLAICGCHRTPMGISASPMPPARCRVFFPTMAPRTLSRSTASRTPRSSSSPTASRPARMERAGSVKCWNERERANAGGLVTTMANITDAVELCAGSMHACARHKTGKVSCCRGPLAAR